MFEQGCRVLITGATSGLGSEMARQLAARQCRLVLTGRRAELLEKIAAEVRSLGGTPLALAGSVSDRATVKSHYAAVREAWGGLDCAILNAGIAGSRSALEFSAKNIEEVMAVNLGGAANWIEAVLPDMITAGAGAIAGISSLASVRGLPRSGAYCASKSALVALLESTRLDLIGTGVTVVVVCPGFVKSEITDKNDPAKMPFLLETDDGARRILAGIERGRRMVDFPWQLSWPLKLVVRNLPGWLYDRIARGRTHRRPE